MRAASMIRCGVLAAGLLVASGAAAPAAAQLRGQAPPSRSPTPAPTPVGSLLAPVQPLVGLPGQVLGGVGQTLIAAPVLVSAVGGGVSGVVEQAPLLGGPAPILPLAPAVRQVTAPNSLVGRTTTALGEVVVAAPTRLDGVLRNTAAPLLGREAPAASIPLSTQAGTVAAFAALVQPPPGQAAQAVNSAMAAVGEDARRLRQQDLVRRNPRLLETDAQGQPIVRGEVLALAPSGRALDSARKAGFTIKSRSAFTELGVVMVVLKVPPGVTARDAVERLRRLDPAGSYEFNHIYSDAGSVGAPARAAKPTVRPPLDGRIGLIDSGIDVRHPSLRSVRIDQRAFAPGGLKPQAHGLATASLLVGSDRPFRSAAPGARLYVADVYGATAAGGSADVLARAFAWMAGERTPVINVSLVGPPNTVLQVVVAALVQRGYLIVAAVGNDGPAAPPLYPGAYPGVVAVTGVNGLRRVLPEAGRAGHVDFAAPGADMVAAGAGGYVAVRGTSFAAPIVAGSLARRLAAPDRRAAAAAIVALGREAADLGAPGIDPVYGRGLVGDDLVTSPSVIASR